MKVIALAYNYKSLNKSVGYIGKPLIFIKSDNAVTRSSNIQISHLIEEDPKRDIWCEVELGFVIGKDSKNVSHTNALDYIDGFLVANDITRQNIDGHDHHLAFSKSHDNFCPLSGQIVRNISTGGLPMKTTINGLITQEGNTTDRVLNDVESLVYISKYISLNKGDIVLTGTTKGAMSSLVKPGDVAELEIEGIGKIVNSFT